MTLNEIDRAIGDLELRLSVENGRQEMFELRAKIAQLKKRRAEIVSHSQLAMKPAHGRSPLM